MAHRWQEERGEGSGTLSNSLSPASKALELADQRYERELRARGVGSDDDSAGEFVFFVGGFTFVLPRFVAKTPWLAALFCCF